MIDKVREQIDDVAKARGDRACVGRPVLRHLGRQLPVPLRGAADDRRGSRTPPHRRSRIHETATTELPALLKRALQP